MKCSFVSANITLAIIRVNDILVIREPIHRSDSGCGLWELIAWLDGQDHCSNQWCLITRNKIGLLIERLTVCQEVPMYVETQMFIAVFTRARYRTLEPLVSIIPHEHHNVCKISFTMILPSTPRSCKWSFSLSFIYWPVVGALSSPSYVLCSPPVSAFKISSP